MSPTRWTPRLTSNQGELGRWEVEISRWTRFQGEKYFPPKNKAFIALYLLVFDIIPVVMNSLAVSRLDAARRRPRRAIMQ